jgi:hypothetical protein
MPLPIIILIMSSVWLQACTRHATPGDWWRGNGELYDIGQVRKPEIPKEGK